MDDTQGDRVEIWELASGQLRMQFSDLTTYSYCLAFSPDSSVLAASMSDTTILLWDLTGRGGRPVADSSRDWNPDSLWGDLDSADAQREHRAIVRLWSNPKEGLALLKEKLSPAQDFRLDRTTTMRLVGELDDRSSQVRQRAFERLRRAGKSMEGSLRQALQGQPSAEMRTRLEALLAEATSGSPPREMIRPLRALEVLEHIGSSEARQLVEKLAGGGADAMLTVEARSSLERMTRRASR